MAEVITIATDKGGDGKTTTVSLLAAYFAHQQNKKGLVIDLDPQGNLSSHYIELQRDPHAIDVKYSKKPSLHPDSDAADSDPVWSGISSSADIFSGNDVYPYPTKLKNLELIPAYSAPLQEVEHVRKYDIEKLVYNRILDFINLPPIQEYDFILIDTRPSKGPLTSAAVKAADHIVIPCVMEYFSSDGVFQMLGMADSESDSRDFERPLNIIGVLPNKVRNVQSHQTNLKLLKSVAQDYVIPYELKERIIYSELMPFDAEKTELYELSPSNLARQEGEKVCRYVFDKVFGDQNG